MVKKKFAIFFRNCQLGFSLKIKVPQLDSALLGTFIARLELKNSSSGSTLVSTHSRYYPECVLFVFLDE